jgi:hypothetical protein
MKVHLNMENDVILQHRSKYHFRNLSKPAKAGKPIKNSGFYKFLLI